MRFYVQLLILMLLMVLPCSAKSGSVHISDFKCVFNGYGDSAFEELSKAVSTGMDDTLPDMYRQKLGPIPGNHRILGHPWALNDSIPSDVLKELAKNYPGQQDVIISVWQEFAKRLNSKALEITGLPKSQANALVAMLYDVHLLGDYEPENVRVDIVLKPEDTVRNFIKESKVLFKNQPQLAAEIEEHLNLVLKNSKGCDGQILAQRLMDEMMGLDIGGKLNRAWGKTLKTKYLPNFVEQAARYRAKRTMTRMAQKGNKTLERNSTPLNKEQFGKKYGKGVLKPAVLLSDGRLLIAMHEGTRNALLMMVIDSAVPTYQYIQGDIHWGEFEERISEAAIKASAVGTATGIAVVLGFTPGGVVVLGVMMATYEVTDLAIKATKHEYLSSRDIEALGGEINTFLELPDDSIMQIHRRSVLQPELPSVLDYRENKGKSILNLLPK